MAVKCPPQENEGLYGGPTARNKTAAHLTVSPHGNPARGHRWQWITKRCKRQKAKETGADQSSFSGIHCDLLTPVHSDPQVQFTPSTQQLNISAPPAWVLTGKATLKCSSYWGQSRRPPQPHWPTFPPLCRQYPPCSHALVLLSPNHQDQSPVISWVLGGILQPLQVKASHPKVPLTELSPASEICSASPHVLMTSLAWRRVTLTIMLP